MCTDSGSNVVSVVKSYYNQIDLSGCRKLQNAFVEQTELRNSLRSFCIFSICIILKLITKKTKAFEGGLGGIRTASIWGIYVQRYEGGSVGMRKREGIEQCECRSL